MSDSFKSDSSYINPIDAAMIDDVCRIRKDNFVVNGVYSSPSEADFFKISAGGTKHDQGKPDFTYLSYEFLEEIAKVREFGAKKYTRGNWKKGFKVTRSLAAALRHIFAFLSGQDNDPESGYSHLAHAACCLEHAIYDMKHRPENDDRKS